jgi:hypothetical protein
MSSSKKDSLRALIEGIIPGDIAELGTLSGDNVLIAARIPNPRGVVRYALAVMRYGVVAGEWVRFASPDAAATDAATMLEAATRLAAEGGAK